MGRGVGYLIRDAAACRRSGSRAGPGDAPLEYMRHWRIMPVVVFLETPVFTRQIKGLVDDEEYRLLQLHLVVNPDAGNLIPRSGGLRKIRLGVAGRGKRGGARIIYYWIAAKSRIYMLLAYAKNEQEDLTPDQLQTLRTLVAQELD